MALLPRIFKTTMNMEHLVLILLHVIVYRLLPPRAMPVILVFHSSCYLVIIYLFVTTLKVETALVDVTPEKKALLIGLNYTGSKSQENLKGCHYDVERVKQCLVKWYGFSEQNIIVLTDAPTSNTYPTGNNIRSALSKLVVSAKPLDILFVYFGGHGNRKASMAEDDDTGFDEFIISADDQPITDDDFRRYINQLPEGCKMTIVADCCSSGGLIEGAKEQIGESTKERCQTSRGGSEVNTIPLGMYTHVNYRTLRPSINIDMPEQEIVEDANPQVNSLDQTNHGGYGQGVFLIPKIVHKLFKSTFEHSKKSSILDCGILLSACQSGQLASEVKFSGSLNQVCGAFTTVMLNIIEENRGRVTNRELVLRARDMLWMHGLNQKPGLYCCDQYADAPFLCWSDRDIAKAIYY